MLSSDNCSRLWINDQMVTDTWTNYVKRKNRVKIKMQKGKKYKIRVEYFNIYGTSFVKLFWKSRSQRLEIVPEKSLYYNPHEKPFAKRSKGLTLYIGVKQNIPHHELLRVIRKVRESSQYLSLITKKELYVDNAIFTFYSAKGHLVWDKYRKKMPMGLDNIPMAPEYWWTQLIVHEFVHSIFKLLDDDIGYGYKWGQAPYRCLMAHNWNAPFCPVCHKRLGLKILYKGVPFHKRPENPVTRITFNYK